MPDPMISHALVLPDENFYEWREVLRPYLEKFAEVAVVRSPVGDDLNRFRNVTAVQTSSTWWQGSALAHIRRIYPQVVMVDIIEAETPQQLEPILQRRIRRADRYGQEDAAPQHIFTRFILGWPTAFRPMAVLAGYNVRAAGGRLRESLDLQASAGADVLCAADGRVTAVRGDVNDLGYRAFIQVESIVEEERFITTYEGIRQVQVRPDISGLRVRPTVNGLRVRRLPSLKSDILGVMHSWEMGEPLEHHGRAIEKIGRRGKWLKVRAAGGLAGYMVGGHLEATTQREGAEVFPGVNPVGVNLDVYHPLGRPNPSRLGEMGWVRLGYNVSNWRGSQDIEAALQRYLPLMEAYRRAGYRIVFTTSHQTYGEGRSQFWPWSQMTDVKWGWLISRFAEMMHAIARQWAGRGLVSAWQVWNEQDSHGHPTYAPFGHIDELVWAYSAVLPRKPLWITEWGVLDQNKDKAQDVAEYASAFIRHLKANYASKIAAIIWYAWAEGMHNGYGIVDAANNLRPPLSDAFLSL